MKDMAFVVVVVVDSLVHRNEDVAFLQDHMQRVSIFPCSLIQRVSVSRDTCHLASDQHTMIMIRENCLSSTTCALLVNDI